MSSSVQIIANDQPFVIEPGLPLPEFLLDRGYAPGQVVVEYNGQPLTPRESQSIQLAADDRLEIVQIVAGG